MRTQIFFAVACALASASAGAITRNDDLVAGLPVFQVAADDDADSIRSRIGRQIDEGQPFAVIGDRVSLGDALSDQVHAWPDAGAWIIDPRDGLGVHGILADDGQARVDAFAAWHRQHGLDVPPVVNPELEGIKKKVTRAINFEVNASTPSAVCQAFGRQMYGSLFGQSEPNEEQKAAFRSEVRRWCQYGVVSHYSAGTRDYAVVPYQDTQDALLTITTEYAFIRSEDPFKADSVKYMMWTKTVGDGAGIGFTRRAGLEGRVDSDGTVRNLMDVSIHSGWGGVASRFESRAWPRTSSFPWMGNTQVFKCDGADAKQRFDCPFRPQLRKLFPQDTYDGNVNASSSVKVEIVGNARISMDGMSLAPKVTFGIDLSHGSTLSQQISMRMTRVFTNADTEFHRSTRWYPDLDAIYRWYTLYHQSTLAFSTPLAATLNPHYEILWELPLQGNAGRVIPYYTFYEAGWNTCDNKANCADSRTGRASLPQKSRVVWFDAVMLIFPQS